jgi:hypothetical protein
MMETKNKFNMKILVEVEGKVKWGNAHKISDIYAIMGNLESSGEQKKLAITSLRMLADLMEREVGNGNYE